MGQSRLQPDVIGTTGSCTCCSWLAHGPQSNGHPCDTGRTRPPGGVSTAGADMTSSYQAALAATSTSAAPCSGQRLLITTRSPARRISAGTLRMQTAQRLVVVRSTVTSTAVGCMAPEYRPRL